MDGAKVYVTGLGNVGINSFLTVIAYDRVTGARLWRTDKKPADAGNAAGLRISMAPDGSLVATGQALRGFLDWYTVAFETTGTVRWEAVRDGGLNTDEIPAAVLVLPDGTSVVTGKGGPNLPGGFIPGVTAGYSPNGVLLWEAFSRLATVWAAALPNGDVVATGGYDAYLAAFRPSTTPGGGTPTVDPYCFSNTHFDSYSYSDSYTYGNRYTHSDSYSYGNADTYCYSQTHADAEICTDTKGPSNAGAETGQLARPKELVPWVAPMRSREGERVLSDLATRDTRSIRSRRVADQGSRSRCSLIRNHFFFRGKVCGAIVRLSATPIDLAWQRLDAAKLPNPSRRRLNE